MKQINTYISEKLKINKDTKVDREKYMTRLTEKYSLGETCLYMKEVGFQSQQRILIDVVQIEKITKTEIHFGFLSAICVNSSVNKGHSYIKMTPNGSKISRFPSSAKYFYSSGMSSSEMILPNKDSLKILDDIRKHNNSCDFFDILWYDGKKKKDYTPVMQKKQYNASSFNDYKNIEEESLNKIEELLK